MHFFVRSQAGAGCKYACSRASPANLHACDSGSAQYRCTEMCNIMPCLHCLRRDLVAYTCQRVSCQPEYVRMRLATRTTGDRQLNTLMMYRHASSFQQSDYVPVMADSTRADFWPLSRRRAALEARKCVYRPACISVMRQHTTSTTCGQRYW